MDRPPDARHYLGRRCCAKRPAISQDRYRELHVLRGQWGTPVVNWMLDTTPSSMPLPEPCISTAGQKLCALIVSHAMMKDTAISSTGKVT